MFITYLCSTCKIEIRIGEIYQSTTTAGLSSISNQNVMIKSNWLYADMLPKFRRVIQLYSLFGHLKISTSLLKSINSLNSLKQDLKSFQSHIGCTMNDKAKRFIIQGMRQHRCSECTNPQIYGTSPFAPSDFEAQSSLLQDRLHPHIQIPNAYLQLSLSEVVFYFIFPVCYP